MTDQDASTVRMPDGWPWLFRLGCPVVGFGLGFAVAPVVRLLIEWFDSAPGPLRVLATLPTGWAVAVTTVLGLVAGVWLAWTARRESLAVTVTRAHVGLVQDGQEAHVPADRIRSVRRDGSDLVLLDDRSAELARRKASDLSWTRLRAAFVRHGYAWVDDSDSDDRFTRWVDGRPDLDDVAHELLRARARARTDKRVGTVAELGERLQTHGVVVRDRGDAQEFRLLRSDGLPVVPGSDGPPVR